MSKKTDAGKRKKINYIQKFLPCFLVFLLLLGGCGNSQHAENPDQSEEEIGIDEKETALENQPVTGIAYETAKDTEIDFKALQMENPDIFAWLYVPGTGIDAPILQSAEADDYYESHNAYGETDPGGALYTELANLKDMCDFNTVIHGKSKEDGVFADLYRFADPDFFEQHEDIYVYIDGNLLTYTVFAAYERENTSLIRSYDFTYGSGCEKFLADMYGSREMGKNLREGWEEVTPYHFLITLTTQREENAEKQFVVLAALVGDAAGTIDRTVEW